jgi:hypothetical protein
MGVRDCINRKFECQNPKFETMSEIQNPNDKNVLSDAAMTFWEFEVVSFEFVSDFDIWISNFAGLAFHIPNRRETHDRLTDPRELSRCDHLIDVFVSWAGFLSEARP